MRKMINHIKEVKKRDGRIVKFQRNRIVTAIFKAARKVGGTDRARAGVVADDVIRRLNLKYKKGEIPGVEDIEDLVEKSLIELGHAKTAKAFILYRDLHNRIRNISSLVDADDLVNKYIKRADWRVKDDANREYSLASLNAYVTSSVSANYWLFSIYPENVAQAHINADIHIHDLGMLSPYCCGWDLRELLLKGFTGVSGKVSWPRAKTLREAISQIVTFVFILQREAAGAQAFSNFDTYLAPFIRYDKLSYGEVKEILKDFLYRMSMPLRVGFENPFSNITLDVRPSGTLAKEAVIAGGEIRAEKYEDFEKEMGMFNRALAEAMVEGDAQGRVFTFPIPTYNITADFNWEDENLEPMWEMTAKYGVPYFCNFINSDMSPEDARSMCCRLRIDNRELRKRGGGLFGANPLTGSIGIVTINLPRIGYLAKNKREFYRRLGEMMDICKESLLLKRKVVEEMMGRGLYPYGRFYLSEIKQRFGEYFRNHFNTIGLVGMNEAGLNLLGKDLKTEAGRNLALEVLGYMRGRLLKYQRETDQMFNLEATPAEAASYRLALHDKKKYPMMVVANEEGWVRGKAPFYTNSSQLAVNSTEDIFEALDNQDELQCRYTGGTVFHGFLGERIGDAKTVRELVKKIATNYKLPYFSITPTFSICPNHGYIKGGWEYCPRCDEEIGYVSNSKIKYQISKPKLKLKINKTNDKKSKRRARK